MKKKNLNTDVKANVVTGMSSATGSAAGVVLGSMMTKEASAAQAVVAENADTATEDVAQTTQLVATASDEQDIQVVVSESKPTPMIQPLEEPEAKPNVLVYETVTNENGDKMDVAVIDVEGQPIGIIDADRDGVADIALADLNGNGELDEGEMEDISELGIDMQQLQTSTSGDGPLTAQAVEADYVNDANVDSYYA